MRSTHLQSNFKYFKSERHCRDTSSADYSSLSVCFSIYIVAVRAGARSTIASLWLVDDESSSILMNRFYQELTAGMSKAKALRHAQLSLLQGNYQHPRYWSAFVLLGNWL